MWSIAVLANAIILGIPMDCLAFFDAKVSIQPSVYWIGGTVVAGAVTGAVTLVLKIVKCVKNHIGRIESFKIFQSRNMCEEKSTNIEEKISTMGDSINLRLDDIKSLIQKNGKK